MVPGTPESAWDEFTGDVSGWWDHTHSEKPAELVIDLIFELGVALWGGVATTVLLQTYVERKYKEGRRRQRAMPGGR